MNVFFCRRLQVIIQQLLCHRIPNLLTDSLQRWVMLLGIAAGLCGGYGTAMAQNFYSADHPFIQYTGRIDFGNPKLPRFWQPGVYIQFQFTGNSCQVILNDEQLWGKNQNYLELVVDGKPIRTQTKSATDTINLVGDTAKRIHSVTIVKNTEANIGYLEFVGVSCKSLTQPAAKPTRKIECIGNSITCGTGSDQSAVPCGRGAWQDQHNAWLSYGAVTARALKAQYHLSSVSGIGLMHSCCNMDIIMPQVFDKISMRSDTINWNFNNYQPDVVTICLGQNDGIQDSTVFCDNYISFVHQLRGYYPRATLVCLTSPMADEQLSAFMKKMILSVEKKLKGKGDKKVAHYFFSKSYNSGCDNHPDVDEHRMIAKELTVFLKKLLKW